MIDPARIKSVVRRSVAAAADAVASLHDQPGPEHWDLGVDDEGRLRRGATSLPDLVRDHGSPIHVVDLDRLDRDLERSVRVAGRNAVAVSHRLISVGPVIRRIHDHGLLGVVSSIDELERAIALGIDPATIVYAEPAPTEASLGVAAAFGVRAVVVCSSGEAELALRAAADRSGEPPLRVLVGLATEGPAGQIGGFPADGEAARSAIERIAAAPGVVAAGVRVVHGSPVTDADEIPATAAVVGSLGELLEACDAGDLDVVLTADLRPPTTASIAGFRNRLNRFAGVDLPAPRADRAPDIGELAVAARAALQPVAPAGVRLVVEPGAALTATAQFLLATVLDIKDDGDPVHVVLDAGINLAEQTQYEYHRLFNASAARGEPTGPYRIVGPICTPADVLYTNWRLPRVAVGDVLAIMDTGAGFVALSTSFSFPRPAVIGCRGDEVVVLRRAETFTDLIELDVIEPVAPSPSAS